TQTGNNIGGRDEAGLDIAGIGEEGASRLDLQKPALSFRADGLELLAQHLGAVAVRRQPVPPGPVERGEERRAARRVGARRPEGRITMLAVEPRDGLLLGRAFGHRLPEREVSGREREKRRGRKLDRERGDRCQGHPSGAPGRRHENLFRESAGWFPTVSGIRWGKSIRLPPFPRAAQSKLSLFGNAFSN